MEALDQQMAEAGRSSLRSSSTDNVGCGSSSLHAFFTAPFVTLLSENHSERASADAAVDEQ